MYVNIINFKIENITNSLIKILQNLHFKEKSSQQNITH